MAEPRKQPDSADPGGEAFAQARASAAAALGRGARVVWLTPPPGFPQGRLLRASVADARGCLVDGHASDLDELASRVLEGLGAPRFALAASVLRAFAAHLGSRGQRLVVGIRHPAALPARTLRELGTLLRHPGNALALVLDSRGDDIELWAALGVEPTRIRAPVAAPTAPGSAERRRGWRLPLALAVGAGLATAAALSVTLLTLRAPSQDPAAPAQAALAPVVVEAAPEVEPEPPAPEEEPERAEPVPSREDPEALRSGRQALAALANARTDAEWEEGTRILHEIGPQPALLESLDELGARPGCVRKRGCVSTRDRLQAALCTAWADAVERGEAPPGLRCS
jgi:hypothetical protein